MMIATLSFFSIPLIFENKKRQILFLIMILAASVIDFNRIFLAGQFQNNKIL